MSHSKGLVQTVLPRRLVRWLEAAAKRETITVAAYLRRLVLEAATTPDDPVREQLARHERWLEALERELWRLTPKPKRRIGPSPAARRSTAKKSTRE